MGLFADSGSGGGDGDGGGDGSRPGGGGAGGGGGSDDDDDGGDDDDSGGGDRNRHSVDGQRRPHGRLLVDDVEAATALVGDRGVHCGRQRSRSTMLDASGRPRLAELIEVSLPWC